MNDFGPIVCADAPCPEINMNENKLSKFQALARTLLDAEEIIKKKTLEQF